MKPWGLLFFKKAQAANPLLAPLTFSTPLCKVRYQKMAAFAERCCFSCRKTASFNTRKAYSKKSSLFVKRYCVCRRHAHNADACDLPPIPEDAIMQAFLRLYDNLKHNHPGIVSREVFYTVQEEMKRRTAAKSPSVKASTGRTSYTSKYALSERLVCGECGTLYRRCTWNSKGEKRIVWRCVSRLDYGKKYCHNSPTMDETPLQEAIMAAVNTRMPQKMDVVTQITDALLQETMPSRGSVMTLGEVKRRIEELTAEFDQLLELDACGNEADKRFAEIAKEMAELKRQQERIAAQLRNNQEAQERAHSIETALDQEDHHIHKWDEEMIRQLVHTVKVISADHIRVFLNDGTEIDQTVDP